MMGVHPPALARLGLASQDASCGLGLRELNLLFARNRIVQLQTKYAGLVCMGMQAGLKCFALAAVSPKTGTETLPPGLDRRRIARVFVYVNHISSVPHTFQDRGQVGAYLPYLSQRQAVPLGRSLS